MLFCYAEGKPIVFFYRIKRHILYLYIYIHFTIIYTTFLVLLSLVSIFSRSCLYFAEKSLFIREPPVAWDVNGLLIKYLRDLEVSLWKVAWFFVEIALFHYYLPLPFFLSTHSLFPLSLFFFSFSPLFITYLFCFLSFSLPLPPSHLFALSLSLPPILFLSSSSFLHLLSLFIHTKRVFLLFLYMQNLSPFFHHELVIKNFCHHSSIFPFYHTILIFFYYVCARFFIYEYFFFLAVLYFFLLLLLSSFFHTLSCSLYPHCRSSTLCKFLKSSFLYFLFLNHAHIP